VTTEVEPQELPRQWGLVTPPSKGGHTYVGRPRSGEGTERRGAPCVRPDQLCDSSFDDNCAGRTNYFGGRKPVKGRGSENEVNGNGGATRGNFSRPWPWVSHALP